MSFRSWWIAIRPATLLLVFVPVILGTAVAAATDRVHWLVAVAALVGGLLLQIAANVANDLFDFLKGADTADRVGPTRAAASGLLSVRQLTIGLALILIAALAVGVYLGWVGGWPLIVLAVVAMVCAVAYTAGPYPLAYHGLGDVFVMLFFGLAAVAGTAYAQTQTVPVLAVVLGVSVGAIAVAVLNVNNIRDIDTDRVAGKNTLSVRFGPQGARVYYTALLVIAYAAPVVAVALGWLSVWGLAVLATAPFALVLARRVWTTDGPALNKALAGTVMLQLVFGATLLPGFVGLGG